MVMSGSKISETQFYRFGHLTLLETSENLKTKYFSNWCAFSVRYSKEIFFVCHRGLQMNWILGHLLHVYGWKTNLVSAINKIDFNFRLKRDGQDFVRHS